MSEANFRKWLKQNKPTGAVMTSIETSTQAGVPDLFTCHRGIMKWIECKYFPNSKDTVRLRATQYIWLKNLILAGGNGGLVIKRGPKSIDYYDATTFAIYDYETLNASGKDIILTKLIKPTFHYDGTNKDEFYKNLLL